MLAYDYPLASLMLTMFWFFLWVLWFMLLFRVFGDIFRSDDLGGGGKTLWCIFVILLPFLGVFVYLIARGGAMGKRDMERAAESEAQFRSYVQDAAGSGTSTAQELKHLSELKESGVLTDAEFESQKAKLLA